MKTIDLGPGDFVVIDLGEPISEAEYQREQFQERVIKPLTQIAEGFRQMGMAFTMAIRDLPRFDFNLKPETLKPERHHMQFIERHIRKIKRK
jgi:hypothetical protein